MVMVGSRSMKKGEGIVPVYVSRWIEKGEGMIECERVRCEENLQRRGRKKERRRREREKKFRWQVFYRRGTQNH